MAKVQDHIVAEIKSKYNQIAQQINYTFKTSIQAMWEIFSFKMHFESHCVFNLKVHLEN